MDRSAAADVLCGCAFCILTTVQTDGFDRCPRFLQAHSIANSIINPRLSDNLHFELSARICTSQAFIQPNPIGFQQEFAVPDGLSVPANLRLVIVPLIHASDAPFLVRGHLPYQSLPIGRCSLFRGMLLHCGMLEVPYYSPTHITATVWGRAINYTKRSLPPFCA